MAGPVQLAGDFDDQFAMPLMAGIDHADFRRATLPSNHPKLVCSKGNWVVFAK